MAKKKNLEWRNCSESELSKKLGEWARTADLSNAIIFLNGQMGAGKSTFARALLEVLAPGQLSKGSPTFPLVQEYRAEGGTGGGPRAGGPIYHIDLYRLKSEDELHESGIESQIEEQGALALVEWADQFPQAFEYWTQPSPRKRAKEVWSVKIELAPDSSHRNFTIGLV